MENDRYCFRPVSAFLLCYYGGRTGREQVRGEQSVTREETEYLADIFRRAASGQEEAEIQKQVKQIASMTDLDREEVYRTYMKAIEQFGLQNKIYEKELVPLSCIENRIEGASESLWMEKKLQENDLWWEQIKFRNLSAIVYRDESEGNAKEILVFWKIKEQDTALKNVWITEKDEIGIHCYWENTAFVIKMEETDEALKNTGEREQIADLLFEDGCLHQLCIKKEKITGRLLRIQDGRLEIEGQGKYPVAEEFQAYRLYDVLCTCSLADISIGYPYADYIVEDGKICAALLCQEEKMESIRVLLQSGNDNGNYHKEVTVGCGGNFRVEWEGGQESIPAGESIQINADSKWFKKGERIRIVPEARTDRLCVESIRRSQGTPSYHGCLEIVRDEAGLYVINEVLLEEYLYAVVPSEMPAGYPLEALKAQSICARTYAYEKLLHAGLPAFGAHVDDSTTYQVYNNIREQERTTQAVKETCGQILSGENGPVSAYYYSTSCGYGTDAGIWRGGENAGWMSEARHIAEVGESGGDESEKEKNGEATAEDLKESTCFEQFIRGTGESDFERNEPWYRWSYTVERVDPEKVASRLRERQKTAASQILVEKDGVFEEGEIKELGDILDIRVEKRRAGGVIDELVIEGSRQTIKVISEYNVRYVLCDGNSEVVKQDGSRQKQTALLPSGFFIIESLKEDGIVIGYRLIGGGYGHGVGMSQNGAASMAESGRSAEDILTFFFGQSHMESIYQ
ncbi:MAG: SpoIID/LytB domain-containing protein [Clostridiales bacterium]|nr:SpoIID/LytB domain-containing protein [Clostridiales bacterium]